MTGVAGVLGRIQELETALQSFGPPRSTVTSATSSATSSAAVATTTSATAEQPSFASVLDSLTVQSASLDELRTSGLAAATASAATAPAASAPGAGAASTTTATPDALVAEARKFLGVPYAWGGESMSGIDCSGLVQRALGALGVDMPRVAREQMKEGSAVASIAEARVGDLLVFDGGSHIAIYLGDGRMIDAPKPGDVVRERDVYETPTAIRRVLTDVGATTAPVSSPVSASGQIDQLLASSAAQRSSLSLLLGAAA